MSSRLAIGEDRPRPRNSRFAALSCYLAFAVGMLMIALLAVHYALEGRLNASGLVLAALTLGASFLMQPRSRCWGSGRWAPTDPSPSMRRRAESAETNGRCRIPPLDEAAEQPSAKEV